MLVPCHACRRSFEVPSGVLSADCPSCGARVTLTALETKPGVASPGAALQVANGAGALVGQVLGGYRLRSVLGGGGMGVVYEAERTAEASSPGPDVAAVKVLFSGFASDPEFVERFRREAEALIALRHPNLIEVYAKGEWRPPDGGAPSYFFVMERFFGDDLRSLVARGPADARTVAAVIRGAAAGLAYAHEHGVVHRDVKPANILVATGEGGVAVKVVDFGIAHLATGPYTLTSLTRSNLVLGTINYMSPEQRIDASEIDARADVYALGVVAYELLTGRLPIGVFEPPSEVRRELERSVDRAVLSALRRDPSERPKSARAFAEALGSALVPRRSRYALLAAALAAFFALGAMSLALALDFLSRRHLDGPGKELQKLDGAKASKDLKAPKEPNATNATNAANAANEPIQQAAPTEAPTGREAEQVAEAMRAATALALEKGRTPVKKGAAATKRQSPQKRGKKKLDLEKTGGLDTKSKGLELTLPEGTSTPERRAPNEATPQPQAPVKTKALELQEVPVKSAKPKATTRAAQSLD